MSIRRLPLAVLTVAFAPSAWAQNGAPPSQTAASSPASQPAKKSSQPPFFRLDYSGDFWTSPGLTGDWGGARTELANKGISLNVETSNYMQGNAHGGRSTNDAFRYGGTADYILQLDTDRMGLWPGGYFKIRGQTTWGHGIGEQVGAIAPPNFSTLLPEPYQPGQTTLTEYYMMQFLSEKFGLIAGQVDLTRLPGQNVFFSDPYGQFMNTALWFNPAGFALVPPVAMTAGMIYMPTKWLSGATLVVDAYGEAGYSGSESALHSPQDVSILQNLTFNIKPFGLDGHQRFNFAYSTRDKIALNDLGRLALAGVVAPRYSRLSLPRSLGVGGRDFKLPHPLLRAVVSRAIEPSPTNSENWGFWYDFDQYLYQSPDDPTQGFGLFGSFGWSPGTVNPISAAYTLGLGGKGLICGRPGDRYGVGYYYMNLSNGIPGLLGVNGEQGVELFYNVEVTPWLHITPDLQCIIRPGGSDKHDVAIVYGLRMQVSL